MIKTKQPSSNKGVHITPTI